MWQQHRATDPLATQLTRALTGLTFTAWAISAVSAQAEERAGTERKTGTKPIEEITVRASRDAARQEPTELTRQLLEVPGTFGDPFAAVFTLPGVVEESEGGGQRSTIYPPATCFTTWARVSSTNT